MNAIAHTTAEAIALARRYVRVENAYPDEQFSHFGIQHVLSEVAPKGTILDALEHEISPDAPSTLTARARAEKLILDVLHGHDEVDLAVYLTVDQTRSLVYVDYGRDVLNMLAYLQGPADKLTFHVSDLPAGVARDPYYEGEELTMLSLDELDIDNADRFDAELYIRHI